MLCHVSTADGEAYLWDDHYNVMSCFNRR